MPKLQFSGLSESAKEIPPKQIMAYYLEDSWKAYERSIFAIADQTFNEIIKPFCKKRKWEFLAGNGSWWIGPQDGDCVYPENCPDDTEFLGIAAVLSAGVPGMSYNDLGSLMPDYKRGQGEPVDQEVKSQLLLQTSHYFDSEVLYYQLMHLEAETPDEKLWCEKKAIKAVNDAYETRQSYLTG